MFGADTALVFDALQMVGIAALATGGAVYIMMRRRKTDRNRQAVDRAANTNLEERVQVLERIATDRSLDLADEIEALREPIATASAKLGGQS